MIKHINNLLENNNLLMGNIVRCFKDGSSLLCTWLSTLEGIPGRADGKESESESCSVVSDSLQPHGPHRPWNSLGQNTGMGSLSLLQQIFPTQESNPGLLHCRWILYQLNHKGNPRILEWVAYLFSSGSSQPRNRTGVSCIAGRFSSIAAGKETDCFYQGLSMLALDILSNTLCVYTMCCSDIYLLVDIRIASISCLL